MTGRKGGRRTNRFKTGRKRNQRCELMAMQITTETAEEKGLLQISTFTRTFKLFLGTLMYDLIDYPHIKRLGRTRSPPSKNIKYWKKVCCHQVSMIVKLLDGTCPINV